MVGHNPRQLELLSGAGPAQSVSHHRFLLSGHWISYTLRRSRRNRSIVFTIDEGGLRVGAPWHASQHRIESLLFAHTRWITRKLTEWEARRPPPFTWQAGALIMVMGLPLQLTPAPERTVTESDSARLYIATGAADPAALAKHVLAWLRGLALAWFGQRVAHYAPVLGVAPPMIRLSNAKTRWGTCHPGGRIRLNWRLIQMPPALIDYVVVHELAHLHEPNHSSRFWRRVGEVLPDHKLLRQTLRREGYRYLIP